MEQYYPKYKDKSSSDKFVKLMTDAPMLPIGFLAFLTVCGHGIYTYRKKKVNLSIFLVQYRVIAQGTFLGFITLGMACTMFKQHIWDKMLKKKE